MGKKEGAGPVDQQFPQLGRPGGVTTDHRPGLGKGGYLYDVGVSVEAKVMHRPPTQLAQNPRTVSVVHVDNRAVLHRQGNDPVERGHVAIHREHPVGNYQLEAVAVVLF